MRNHTLDLLRGITIIAMIWFHFSFDLNHFNLIDINIRGSLFWQIARWSIVSSFVFIMGYSLVLAYGNGIDRRKAALRFGQLFGLGMLITLATYFIFPKSWIYFGILHFAAFATLIGLLLIRLPILAFILGVGILYGYSEDYLSMRPFFDWLRPYLGLPQRTEDLVLFFPWLAPLFFGITAGYYKVIPALSLPKGLQEIAWLGRHSLAVYIIHQPILFGSLMLIYGL